MESQMSIVKLVLDASFVVQLVLLLLLSASVMSWTLIFSKRSMLARTKADAAEFEESFWSGGDLGALYRTIQQRGESTGMSSIFEFGFREFARLRQAGCTPDQTLDGARRAM
jgi:biopolymer transport protein TolQ